MQAILYVGHGSRNKLGEAEVITFFNKAKKKMTGIKIQEISFIEISEPSISVGIDACIKKGATKIAVVPLLLLSATHAKIDIPKVIESAQKIYQGVTFTYGRPLGVDRAIIDILKDNLEEHGLAKVDHRPSKEERQGISVLLIGRGSKDPVANRALEKIAQLLWDDTPIANIEVCYLAATTPNLEDGLKRIECLSNKTVYVLPYLLFTGVLMHSIQKKISSFTLSTKKQYQLCSYLGLDDKLLAIFVQRIKEALDEQGTIYKMKRKSLKEELTQQ